MTADVFPGPVSFVTLIVIIGAMIALGFAVRG